MLLIWRIHLTSYLRHIFLNRKTCSQLYLVTLDRALWIAIALHLSKSLPLPSSDRIRASALSELELIAVQAVNVEKQWLLPRTSAPRKIEVSRPSQRADYLKLFEHRFAIVVYTRPCMVTLWDLDGLQSHKCEEQYRRGTILGRWVYDDRGAIVAKTCSAQFRESSREIFVSFCLAEQTYVPKYTAGAADDIYSSAYASYVLSIPISGIPAGEHTFRQVARLVQDLDFDSPLVSTCLNPDSSYLARSRQGPEAIELINLEHGYSRSITATHNRIGAEESIRVGPAFTRILNLQSYLIIQEDSLLTGLPWNSAVLMLSPLNPIYYKYILCPPMHTSTTLRANVRPTWKHSPYLRRTSGAPHFLCFR